MDFPSLDADEWIRAHSPMDPRKLHAMGCLNVEWSTCEYWAHATFGTVLGSKTNVAYAISHDMGDISLWNRIRDVAETRKFEAEDREALSYASKYYERCRTNRNQLVHFSLVMGANELRLARKKGPKLLEQQLFADSLEDVRRVCMDLSQLRRHLMDLNVCLWGRESGKPTTWPTRPPLPALIATPSSQTRSSRS